MSTPRISVVGIGCRYPDAEDPEQLWQNVLAGRRAFRALPEQRLAAAYRGGPGEVDHTYLTRAAVLRDWHFDRAAFGVPGSVHRAVDLTHWLALETAAVVLADAGFPGGDGLDRDTVGVILGNSLTGEFSRAATMRLRWPFVAEVAADALRQTGLPAERVADALGRMEAAYKTPFPVPGDETLAGALSNTISGRICNTFDFHGTGFTVDGACSSSLLAVGLACSALAEGDCDVMIAGGVDLSMDPFELVGFSRLGALATGEMRVYDADPTGFLPGEGCGMVMLVRAEDAAAKGMRVYADIVGWASSSDGAGGLTRPGVQGQVAALHRAYRRAGLHPRDAQLIEGHGTGTAIGDEVELTALHTARGEHAHPAALGSIKANIGHTKAAAGAAGLLKVTQAVHRRVLPPTSGWTRPHPLLARPGFGLRLVERAAAWADERPTAGVSSMGFGGINAHLVVQAAADAPRRARMRVRDREWSRPTGWHEIVLLDADDAASLRHRLADLAEQARALSTAELRDIAATRWHAHTHRPHQVALVAATPEELVAAARAAGAAPAVAGRAARFDAAAGWALGAGRPVRTGLLLPGQASPVHPTRAWWAETLPRRDLDGLPRPAPGGGPDTAVAQPWIVEQSLAALDWLAELGCEPTIALGHSLGEISALAWAGSLSGEAALALATARGRLMAEHGRPGTGMAAIGAAVDAVGELLAGTSVIVSGDNACDRIVVSGPCDELDAVLTRAVAAGIGGVRLPVSHGFHSSAMADAEPPLRDVLAATEIRSPERTIVSSITGAVLGPGTHPDEIRKLLVSQLVEPVLFRTAAAALVGECELLVEAGPGHVLTGLVGHDHDIAAVSMDSGGPARGHAVATAVLAVCADADLSTWFRTRPHRQLAPSSVPGFLSGVCAPVPAPSPPAPARAPTAPASERAGAGAGSSEPVDALAVVTEHLAVTLELPAATIRPDWSLLGDLHLSSLQVVQTVVSAATALGVAPPAMPPSVASLTVSDLVAVLADCPDADATGAAQSEPAVRPWVRAFVDRWQPVDVGCGPREEVCWTIDAPSDHPWHALAGGTAGPIGLAVVWAAGPPEPAQVVALLRLVDSRRPGRLLLGHDGHPGAVGAARALVAELDDLGVVVLDTSAGMPPVDVLARLADPGPGRYRELRTTDGAGSAEVRLPEPRPQVPQMGEPPLPNGAVCLVTGGVAGITARCARALAADTGAVLVFLGRTDPEDPLVSGPLLELRAEVAAHYVRCDVTDTAQVEHALAVAAGHGPVLGLLHGAALNTPRRLAEVDVEGMQAVLRPKVDGLTTLLQVGGDSLRLVVTFGSIIGRQGLAGQSEYCVANDWMRHVTERWAAAHPEVRARVVQWSAWAGVGMADRLGVLDVLRSRGVLPVEPDVGAALFMALLGDPETPITVLATSRFVPTDTLALPSGPARLLRFTEVRTVHLPGVELVAEAELAVGEDPYLDDHRIAGIAVLPAVLGVEAMAQAAAALRGGVPDDRGCSVADLRFAAPITVADGEPTRVRTVALAAEGPDRSGGWEPVEVVLRAATDGFALDRFRGRVESAGQVPEPVPAATVPTLPPGEYVGYGPPLFHAGRFRRVARYDLLSAFRVHAWLRAGQDDGWFAAFHSPELVLGDPGAFDAALHALLPCVPHRLALPIGVDRWTTWRRPSGVLRVEAAERWHGDGEFCFDVDLRTADGAAVARWDGLLLRATGPVALPDPMPVEFVGPWLSRRILETGTGGRVELCTPCWDGPAADVPGAGDVVLVAVDDEPSTATRHAAEDVVDIGGNERAAHARVRAAVAVLGEPAGPLRVGRRTEDGLVELECAGRRVVTAVVRTIDGEAAVGAEVAS